MFCPKGYVSLSEAMRRIPDSAYEVAEAMILHFDKSIAMPDDRYMEHPVNQFFYRSPQDILEHDILTALDGRLYVSSPTGVVLKFDHTSLAHGLLEPWIGVQLIENLQHSRWIEVVALGRLLEVTPEWLVNEFLHPTFVENYENSSQLMDYLSLNGKFMNISLWFERIGYTISLQSWDHIKLLGLDDLTDFEIVEPILRKFAGWSLCISEADCALLLTQNSNESPTDQHPDVGNISINQTRATVAEEGRVSRALVVAFDADSQLIKAAARKLYGGNLGTRAFDRAWAKASETRPGLGQRGAPKRKHRFETPK